MWIIYAVLASITWGLCYALDEQMFDQHISPAFLLTGSSLLGTIVFGIIAYFSHLKTDIAIVTQHSRILGLFIATIIVAVLGNYLIACSINAKNAVFAALIEEAYPIFTVIFGLLLFHKNHLTLPVVVGGIFILTGVIIITVMGK